MRRLREEGLYGPRFRDVLPAFLALTVVVCGLVAGVVAGSRAAGLALPLGALALLLVVVTVVLRRRRPRARRRRGLYTADELFELDVQQLALAVARMMRRERWKVRTVPSPDLPRLCARHPDGRRFDVAFRPVAEPLPDEDLPHPRSHREDPRSLLRLVVHRGLFRERDRRWARRDGRTYLLDRERLRRWAEGTPLTELLAERF